jgi:PAS domain-containing protein
MPELPAATEPDAGKEERVPSPRTRFRRRTDRFFLTEQAGRTLPLVLTDSDGTVRSWSRGAADLYGLSEAEAIGGRWAALSRAHWALEQPEYVSAWLAVA